LLHWWHAAYWSPIVSGAIIGLAQVPLVLSSGKTMGASSCYVTVVANCVPEQTLTKGNHTLGLMQRNNWWQPIFLGAALVSGFVNALASGVFGHVTTLPIHECIIGGMLLIAGARLAGGCPSGHGLSGIPFLSTRAFGAVAGMFAGGFIAGSFL